MNEAYLSAILQFYGISPVWVGSSIDVRKLNLSFFKWLSPRMFLFNKFVFILWKHMTSMTWQLDEKVLNVCWPCNPGIFTSGDRRSFCLRFFDQQSRANLKNRLCKRNFASTFMLFLHLFSFFAQFFFEKKYFDQCLEWAGRNLS